MAATGAPSACHLPLSKAELQVAIGRLYIRLTATRGPVVGTLLSVLRRLMVFSFPEFPTLSRRRSVVYHTT